LLCMGGADYSKFLTAGSYLTWNFQKSMCATLVRFACFLNILEV
jgi:hypothetical protein